MESTVVDISIPPPFFNLFRCLCHDLLNLKRPSKSFLTQYKYILTSFNHTLLLFYNYTFFV